MEGQIATIYFADFRLADPEGQLAGYLKKRITGLAGSIISADL